VHLKTKTYKYTQNNQTALKTRLKQQIKHIHGIRLREKNKKIKKLFVEVGSQSVLRLAGAPPYIGALFRFVSFSFRLPFLLAFK
jgi:hypothetical protein